jgi:hypothetical protein
VPVRDPLRPQDEIQTTTGNQTAHIGPYTDRSLTTRNPADVDIPANPRKTGSADQGNVRRFYAVDKVDEKDSEEAHPEVDPAPHSGNSWQREQDGLGITRSRDPYRQNGMTGQNFFRNGG